MAIATYTDLLARVADWLGRSDLTNRIPEFVTLAQARINRQVRAKAMETKTTSFSITAEYVAVPTDFLQVKHFYINSPAPRKTLEPMESGLMTDTYTTSGVPKFFSVEGSEFRFSPSHSQTYTATLVYHLKPATLAAGSQETNTLFPANADLYLYATLLEAVACIGDHPNVGLWKQGYEEALANLNSQSGGWRHGGPLMTRPG